MKTKMTETALIRTAETSSTRPFNIGAIIGAGAAAILVLLISFADLPRETVGVLVVLLVLALLMTGVGIGIAMIAASFLGMWKISGPAGTSSTFQELVYGASASWSMSVLPLFILMGIVLWKAGLTGKAFATATQWMGGLPGGLAVATNFSGAGLAAASGSSLGISYALGRIAIPEMLRAGYKPSLATATVAMAGTLGQLIPPSILLVVYAGVAQTPVGPQLMAAIVPGIILAVLYGVMIVVRAMLNPSLAPRADMTGVTWGTRFRSLTGIVPVLIVVIVVIGGLSFGIFTPTESGAFGALAAIIIGWLASSRENRTLRGFLRFMKASIVETTLSTAGIFLMLIGVSLLTRVLTVSRLTTTLTELIVELNLGKVGLLLVLVVLYLLLGMFLDPLAMMLLTVPVLAGPLAALDINMLWFGVFLIILCEIGQVSPPVGLLSFVVHKIAQDPAVNLGQEIKLTDVFKGVMWFIVIALFALLLIGYFPELVLWLPSVGGTS